MKRALILAALALALLPGSAHAAGLQLGILDGRFSTADRAPWLQRAADSGAGIVRIDVGWPAPSAPADPRDPADPAYDFSNADASIKAASADGLQVLASFTGAPAWAEGPNRDPDAEPGTWKPDPQAIEDYAYALGTRYSGSFPDPAAPGQTLPKVQAFQVWNEPNLSKYLTPQWNGTQPASPAQYRLMLNAFYRGIKATAPAALVVSAGTGPFGDLGPGGNRIMPARFVRELLSAPVSFDVLAHHPYSVGAPTRKALNADDVSIPDIGKLTRILRAAEKAKRALPGIHHRVWVTEVSYDSSPPDPAGIPAARHAGYLAQTFYLLARAGVDTIFWFQVGDQAPDPSFAATNQSGLYTLDGKAKPAQRAFRFPVYVHRTGRRTLSVWGRAPATGRVRLERRAGNRWRRLRSVAVKAGQTFQVTVAASSAATVRARLGAVASIAWAVH